MRPRAERGLTLACALLLLSGCAARRSDDPATTGDQPPSGQPTPTGKCIFLDTINDWKAVDPYHLLVRTRATGWQWEVTLDRRCSEILYASALAWDTPDGRVCDYRADAITVPRTRCSIGSIEAYVAPPEVTKPPPSAGGW